MIETRNDGVTLIEQGLRHVVIGKGVNHTLVVPAEIAVTTIENCSTEFVTVTRHNEMAHIPPNCKAVVEPNERGIVEIRVTK